MLAKGGLTLGVRPESWRLTEPGEGFPVRVAVVEELGADAYIYGTCEIGGTAEQVVVRVEARRQIEKGSTVHVTTDSDKVHLFDTDSGARLA